MPLRARARRRRTTTPAAPLAISTSATPPSTRSGTGIPPPPERRARQRRSRSSACRDSSGLTLLVPRPLVDQHGRGRRRRGELVADLRRRPSCRAAGRSRPASRPDVVLEARVDLLGRRHVPKRVAVAGDRVLRGDLAVVLPVVEHLVAARHLRVRGRRERHADGKRKHKEQPPHTPHVPHRPANIHLQSRKASVKPQIVQKQASWHDPATSTRASSAPCVSSTVSVPRSSDGVITRPGAVLDVVGADRDRRRAQHTAGERLHAKHAGVAARHVGTIATERDVLRCRGRPRGRHPQRPTARDAPAVTHKRPSGAIPTSWAPKPGASVETCRSRFASTTATCGGRRAEADPEASSGRVDRDVPRPAG